MFILLHTYELKLIFYFTRLYIAIYYLALLILQSYNCIFINVWSMGVGFLLIHTVNKLE